MLYQAIAAQPIADILWPVHQVLLNQLPLLPIGGLSQCATTVHTHDDDAMQISGAFIGHYLAIGAVHHEPDRASVCADAPPLHPGR